MAGSTSTARASDSAGRIEGSDRAAAGARRQSPPRTTPSLARPLEPRPSFLDWEYWTPEARKGWAGSLAAHALLLVVLGCWYFAPRLDGPATFDSRLAGSPNGVSEGDQLTGGLNTPLPMPAAPAGRGRDSR